MKKQISIGIDIGGSGTQYGFVEKNGKIIICDSILTNVYPSSLIFIETLANCINSYAQQIKDDYEISGIGIGAPNGNYFTGTIEFAPNLHWKEDNIKIVDEMKKHFNCPVILTNDANAAAIGEMVYGDAKGMQDFIVITLGTGLGSGIVAHGDLIYGHDGFAGELGHVIVVPGGRPCGCGRNGCLETYASATGIKKTVLELLSQNHQQSELREISLSNLSGKVIERLALSGDKMAIKAFEITGKILGEALANTVALTSPEAIFLFGGLANAGDLIFKPVKENMELNLLRIFQNKVKILPSGLHGTDAAILGASALVWKDLKNFKKNNYS